MTSTKTYFFVALICLIAGLFVGYSFNFLANNKEAPMHHEMSMESAMHSMNAGLEGKTGDEFDKAFLNEMIVHHEGAVAMARQVLQVSKRPELINLANAIISAQNREISQMKTWRDSWFNAAAPTTPVQKPVVKTPVEQPVACTMEARICPDGSYVGRQGPNCEFAKCPGN